MLEKLTIKNVALIERAELEFSEGLNVLSGETGSGKSVILDSINFVLGAKADKSMIRYGEEECAVSAVFRLAEGGAVFGVLDELGVESDDLLIISRRYRRDGRGDIKVNGSPVNASMLRKITSRLVDVHGQSDHFYLLNASHQLETIDRFAGEPAEREKSVLKELAEKRRGLRGKLKALGGDEAERGRRLDILKYQLEEIDKADLKEGEEEELLARRLILSNAEKILQGLSEASESLNGEGAAVDALSGGRRAMNELSRYGEEYASLAERLENVLLETEDIAETIRSLAEDFSYNEYEAEEVESRLDHIKALKKKYGGSVSEIFAFRDKAAEEAELLEHCDEEFSKISAELKKNAGKIRSACERLTAVRKAAADEFCRRVERELKTLNIKNARFCAEFNVYSGEDAEDAGENGADSVTLMFSANAGEPLKPLDKVISGGEMSRLMLAIKTQMSGLNEISTYIFDEIDAGISGNTAKVVAEKFADIAKEKQIIAVSHLAQIVAMADANFLISKRETGEGKTITELEKLEPERLRGELTRLLGGSEGSNAAAKLADELTAAARQYKKNSK